MFRDQIFVIALDGSLLADDAIQNVLLDIAVLRSLSIRVVLVHGIGHQMLERAGREGVALSDPHGEGPTDDETLRIALEASTMTSHRLMQGLTRVSIRAMLINGVRSTNVGIVHGKDQLHTGKVDKIDLPLFNALLTADCVPVIAPIAFNRDGSNLRINSDLLAATIAAALRASKLIYLTTEDGMFLEGVPATNVPVKEMETLLDRAGKTIPPRLLSKVRETVRAIKSGVPRAHILDGRKFGALLNEIFDKVGVGTMVYSNEYQSIRRATRDDSRAIYNITRNAVKSEELKQSSLEMIRSHIEQFLVFEIDGSIVACARLIPYDGGRQYELGHVYVQSFYQQKGVGRTMVAFACEEAERRGAETLFALSTQAIPFFTTVCGFTPGTVDDLPAERVGEYQSNGRNSQILIKRHGRLPRDGR